EEEVVYVRTKHCLDSVVFDHPQQPGPGRLVDIVVVPRFIARGDERRIMNEEENSAVFMPFQVVNKPFGLLLLQWQTGIEQRGIDYDEVASAVVEAVEVPSEMPGV